MYLTNWQNTLNTIRGSMSFLPSNYVAPKSAGNYFRIQDGENKIRILSAPVLGWEDWEGNKPIRFRFESKPAKAIDPKKPVKHFWAMIIWNYQDEKIQIAHLTQASIRSSIEALSKDKDWGLPYFYDIKIIKSGEGKETEYTINPLPHKELGRKVKEEFDKMPVNLEALFDGADPFSLAWDETTKGIFSKEDLEGPPKLVAGVNLQQVEELKEILKGCSQEYIDKLWDTLKGPKLNISKIEDIPVHLFGKIRDAAMRNRDEQNLPF